MSKVVLCIERGLDGDIARENGEFDSFFSSIDTVFLGRKTYEQISELADEPPLWVSNEREVVDDFATYIQPEQISPLINLLKKITIRIYGSQVVHSCFTISLTQVSPMSTKSLYNQRLSVMRFLFSERMNLKKNYF